MDNTQTIYSQANCAAIKPRRRNISEIYNNFPASRLTPNKIRSNKPLWTRSVSTFMLNPFLCAESEPRNSWSGIQKSSNETNFVGDKFLQAAFCGQPHKTAFVITSYEFFLWTSHKIWTVTLSRVWSARALSLERRGAEAQHAPTRTTTKSVRWSSAWESVTNEDDAVVKNKKEMKRKDEE